MEHENPTSEGRLLTGVLLTFVAIALLAGLDIASDLAEGTTLGHVLAEGGVFLAGLTGAAVMARLLLRAARQARAARLEASGLAAQLKVSEAEATRWREETRDVMQGLSAAIDRQFQRWALSPAEKEVAFLLLKGLSHKEIGDVRSISEATARQQARAVYKKAGLTGRNDLAAFFLEDLLPGVPAGREPQAP